MFRSFDVDTIDASILGAPPSSDDCLLRLCELVDKVKFCCGHASRPDCDSFFLSQNLAKHVDVEDDNVTVKRVERTTWCDMPRGAEDRVRVEGRTRDWTLFPNPTMCFLCLNVTTYAGKVMHSLVGGGFWHQGVILYQRVPLVSR